MFDINKTDSMTSRGRENQLADEDEGEIIDRRDYSILKNSSLLREKKSCLPKRQLVIILFETDIVLFAS